MPPFRPKQLLNRTQMILNTPPKLRAEDRLLQRSQAALLDGPKRADQIAIVYRGDESWLDGFERLRVVPVVHLPIEPRHAIDGIERSFRIRGEFRQGQKAQVNGCEPGVQEQSEVRRRDAVNNLRCWFHDRVWNKPVFF